MEKATCVSVGCRAAPRPVAPRSHDVSASQLRLHCFSAKSLLLFVLRLNLSASLFDSWKNGTKLGSEGQLA